MDMPAYVRDDELFSHGTEEEEGSNRSQSIKKEQKSSLNCIVVLPVSSSYKIPQQLKTPPIFFKLQICRIRLLKKGIIMYEGSYFVKYHPTCCQSSVKF